MRRFGLIGHPLGHSLSKAYFNGKFARQGIDARYDLFDLGDISALRQLVRTEGLNGFNVTIPHKVAIVPLLDALAPSAHEVGAVNTVAVLPDGRLIGHNTDVDGLRSDLADTDLTGKHALILGTGGAARAALAVLAPICASVRTVSRTAGRAHHAYSDCSDAVRAAHLIINCTGIGTWPHVEAAPALPYGLLGPQHFLYDMTYNPEVTAFMRHGMAAGCKVRNGLGMLHAQAEAAWQVWDAAQFST
jgi:shikimate dehydrogenase